MEEEVKSIFNTGRHHTTLLESQPDKRRRRLKQHTVETKRKTTGTFTVSNAKVYHT